MGILIVNLMWAYDDTATSAKYGSNRRTGFIWLIIATSDELFMNTVITFKFHKRREILLDERQLASQEGLCSVELNFFFFFHCHYSPLWALACRTMSFHFFLSATNSLHLLTPCTWRSLSTSPFHPFLGLPICHQLSPSSYSQHLKIYFYFPFPSFPGSSPSSCPFQFFSEDLFGHPILLHSV